MKKIITLTFILSTFSIMAAEHKFLGQEYPPLNYMDGSTPKGAMIDLVNALCTKINEKCTVEIQPLKRVTTALENGEITAGLSLIPNKDRDVYGLATGNIFKANQALWMQDKGTPITKIEDLKGRNAVAVVASGSLKMLNELATKATSVTVTDEPENETMLKKLSAGRFGDNGVALTNESVASFLIKKNKLDNLKSAFVVKSENFAIYFSKKSSDFAFYEKFNAELEKMKKDGSLKAVLSKYNIEMP